MEHWFDGLVKDLASGGGTRRSFLGGIFASLGAAAATTAGGAGLGLILPSDASAQTRTARSGSCTLDVNGKDTSVHHSVQSTFNGKVLAHVTSLTLTRADRRGQAPHITSTRTITLGGDALIKIEHDSQGGTTRVNLTYGSAFQGIREASYTTDGKTIQGTIDGQRIAPLPEGADPKSLKLADGKTPPPVKLDPGLATALDGLLQKAKADAATCNEGNSRRASISHSGWPTYESSDSASRGWQSALSGRLSFLSAWFTPDVVHADSTSPMPVEFLPDPQGGIPQNSSACQDCQDKCGLAAAACDAGACGASIACLFAWGACCLASLAVCAGTAAACDGACDSQGTPTQPGGACCPIYCPAADGCCYQNQQCSSTANVCCASNVVVCNGNCCPPGFVCKEGVCCTPDRQVCHGVCCPAESICSNEGICCKQLELNVKPISCGGSCCAKGQKCAKGYAGSTSDLCCPDNQVCSDGVCCPHGCVNGACRPLCLVGVPCGSSCCDWGCEDAARNTCKKAQTCARGQSVCTANQAGVANVCCPTGTGCLDGKCCPTGTVACNNKSTGKMGCFPKAQCAAPPPPPK